jgi:DNA topoisomerase-1
MTLAHTENPSISVSKKQLVKALKDYKKSAELSHLTYVSDSDEGIKRVKSGKTFKYYFKNKKISDTKTLSRIQHLVIPPAWVDVWICADENGHIQVTGYDAKNRKQYRYHSSWSILRDQTKFFRIMDFANSISKMRSRINEHLAQRINSKTKVLAAVISIMETTSIRVGNSIYEKLYASYGLSTMQDKHVKIIGDEVNFYFKGKKGIYHRIHLKSKKLAKIVSQCKDIPGKELFQYYDEVGNKHTICSGEVNSYIREISGGDFTSKDFRTWNGTVKCLEAFIHLGFGENASQNKKIMNEAIDMVASQLGNTRSVCKKHYIHPQILSHFETGMLNTYICNMPETLKKKSECLLTDSEMILLKILQSKT